MAEQIRQEFIIDAADALRDLKTLMDRYKSLNTTLNKFGGTAARFNTNASKVVASLKRIKDEAKLAADQLKRVSGYKGIVAAAPRAAAGAKAGAGVAGVDPAQAKKAAASLEQLRAAAQKIFSGAAIQNQKAFKKGLNELVVGFHRTGGTVDEFKEKVKKLDSQINGSKARMTAAMRAIGRATRRELNPAPVQSFAVSWKTMLRIVTTQLIVRGLNLLKQAFKEAIKGSIEFQRSIAEVATIANDAYGSLADIAKIVRDTSDEFGKGRLDVAEGLYQTLSNQVGDASESLHVFNTANKLSIAAVSSTEDSVNLLTAALNSFDISTNQSESVAAKLFKTVELGRTRISELANTFGRIGPLAHSLGISLEETLAAIATITVQGTRTAESMTQVRGVMQALLKPSDNLKVAFKQLGFANAEQIIATYGFQGALTQLQTTVGSSSSEMGKLIRRVRGLLGTITLASQDAETFVDNLRQIGETSAEILEKKYKLVFDTPGEELAREFNKLKNILVEDIGRALVDTTLYAIKFAKSLTWVYDATMTYGTTLAVFLIPLMSTKLKILYSEIAAWITLRAEVVLTQVAMVRAGNASIWAAVKSAAMWAIAAAPVAVVAGIVALFTYNLKRAANEVHAMNVALAEYIDKQYELEKAIGRGALEQQFELQKKINQQNLSDTLKTIAAVQRAYQKQAVIIAENNRREVSDTKDKFNTILEALKDYQSAYEDVATDAADAISESQDRIYDINRKGEDDKYQRSLRFLDSQDKVHAQQRRILELSREGASLLVTGKPEDIERALALYGEAENIYGNLKDLAWDQLEPLEKAYKAGELSKSQFQDLRKARLADNQALKLGTNLTNARLAAEKKLQAVAQEKQRIAEERAATLKKLNREFQGEFDIIFKNMNQFDKSNKRLSAKELQDQSAARARAFANIRNLAKELPEFDYQDFFGLAQLSSELDGMLSDKELTISEASINQMGETIAKGFSDYMGPVVEAQIKAMSKVMGVEFDPTRGVENLSNAYLEANKNAIELRTTLMEIKQLEVSVAAARTRGERALIAGTVMVVPPLARKAFENAVDLIGKMKSGTDLTNDEWQLLETQIQSVDDTIDGVGDRSDDMAAKLRVMRDAAGEVLVNSKKIREETEAYTKLGGDQKLLGIERALAYSADGRAVAVARMLPLRAAEDLAIQGTKSLEQELAGIQQNRLNDSLKAIDIWKSAQLTAYEDVARKIQNQQQYTPPDVLTQAAGKQLGGLIQGYAKGGLINKLSYLAKGNLARGTDTIPAMLSPGEFVMNAKSTRQFFSQLVAMNSGRAPVFRQDGGSVTNVTVGDVNINGGSGKGSSAHQQGRQVVAVIKREMRRGTSSF